MTEKAARSPSDDRARFLFHQAHYNILAKIIRESFMVNSSMEIQPYKLANSTVEDLACRLAVRLLRDHPKDDQHYGFDVEKFLNACTPEHYPHNLFSLYQESYEDDE